MTPNGNFKLVCPICGEDVKTSVVDRIAGTKDYGHRSCVNNSKTSSDSNKNSASSSPAPSRLSPDDILDGSNHEQKKQKILEGLTEEQRKAVHATKGRIRILAGAGTGKTTTITRRIAYQVLSGTCRPEHILALTFTRKAAEEMGVRLKELGVSVEAKTFHAIASKLLAETTDGPMQVLGSKLSILTPIQESLPQEFRNQNLADIATEIEMAKNRMILPDHYERRGWRRDSPLPAQVMGWVYREYEKRKDKARRIDHEDQLWKTIAAFEKYPEWLADVQQRYLAFTVDEFQDTNQLQHTLLGHLVGNRDDLCVVGDDYQSIFGFQGSSPDYLLNMPKEHPETLTITLETNHRSTPQILDRANNLAAYMPRAAEKTLRGKRSDGEAPVEKEFKKRENEQDFVATQIQGFLRAGQKPSEIAILYRLNAQSSPYERILSEKKIPFEVRDGSLLARSAWRDTLRNLNRPGQQDATGIASVIHQILDHAGYMGDQPQNLGRREQSRQADMATLLSLANIFDNGEHTITDFIAHVKSQYSREDQDDAIQLMTYHSAKGLEFEVVFLPELDDNTIPDWRNHHSEDVPEERRLFYVAITRAKTRIYLTWSPETRANPRYAERKSRFLLETGRPKRTPAVPRPKRTPAVPRPKRTPAVPRPKRTPAAHHERTGPVIPTIGMQLEWRGFRGTVSSIGTRGIETVVNATRIAIKWGTEVTTVGRSIETRGPLTKPN